MSESILNVRRRFDGSDHEPAPHPDDLKVLLHLAGVASLEVHLLQGALVMEEHVDGPGLAVAGDHDGVV